jgi:DNA-binding XRE family transcriptional regulator
VPRVTRVLTETERAEMMENLRQQRAAHHQAGKKLQEARRLLWLSREDVAAAIERAATTISAWESGGIPGTQIREALCTKLGLSREYMDRLWDFPHWQDPR